MDSMLTNLIEVVDV